LVFHIKKNRDVQEATRSRSQKLQSRAAGLDTEQLLKDIAQQKMPLEAKLKVLKEMTENTPGILLPANEDLKHVGDRVEPLYIIIAKSNIDLDPPTKQALE